ncbi:hypothetical protein [Cyclobacterium qasimii]|uniref:Uncharacterized protein n=2 Tax=Cyclobacterium qasimii TaxID=1350429 RepID=S7V680_9BACT|nr:hypothetical protein [Cyclobacterium qasimii]EPR65690.1 hypothetical protein ADICYQ_5325 [Cyclobacterium qasimii M12-11B]GEO23566.1 hypothetical protein CQA01_41000 [Cyclobacterium qasimii]
MRNINLIVFLVLLSFISSCSKDNEETPKSTENGYTFNTEFFPTDKLILTSTSPEEAIFIILDDNAVFNSTTGKFEGNTGRGILIAVRIDEDASELSDLAGAYTQVIDPNGFEGNGDFIGGLFMDFGSLESAYNNDNGTGTNDYLLAITGDVRVRFNSETEIFTIEYTLTTNQGIITGAYEGVSQQFILN